MGVPTSYALSPRGSSRIWPRCTNAEPGSYGHECGEPADFIGSRADGGQSCFCSACKAHGSEARCYSHWHALQAAMGQRERGCRGNGCARLHRDASGRSWLRLDRPHLGQHARTSRPTGLRLAVYSDAFCSCDPTRRMIRPSRAETELRFSGLSDPQASCLPPALRQTTAVYAHDRTRSGSGFMDGSMSR